MSYIQNPINLPYQIPTRGGSTVIHNTIQYTPQFRVIILLPKLIY